MEHKSKYTEDLVVPAGQRGSRNSLVVELSAFWLGRSTAASFRGNVSTQSVWQAPEYVEV